MRSTAHSTQNRQSQPKLHNKMKKLQIACVPAEWDESTITAVGLRRNGRHALPVSTTARELPEPWLTVWHGLVNTLRGVAPGEWAASFIEAQLDVPADSAPDAGPQAAVRLLIHRRWDDQTTAEPIRMLLAGDAVTFFNHLTRDE